ncbi:hypothetical protein F4804DRAFT_295758 [Jackrogersella minutella]|nr:hypothetical protein F4804DRAFT_295758 [Jackrogersella minutella]
MPTVKSIGPIRKAWYQWKALRLPWRKRFLVGLDLQGNTYWEFQLVRGDPSHPDSRFRRIVKYPRSTHFSDVAVPPQWHQWLRHQRERPPTLQEQAAEVARQDRIKVLAAEADARWEAKPSLLDTPVPRPENSQSQSAPPLDTTRTRPREQVVRESPTRNRRDSDGHVAKQKDDEPWKKAARSSGPGETWQPEAWSPTSARKR